MGYHSFKHSRSEMRYRTTSLCWHKKTEQFYKIMINTVIVPLGVVDWKSVVLKLLFYGIHLTSFWKPLAGVCMHMCICACVCACLCLCLCLWVCECACLYICIKFSILLLTCMVNIYACLYKNIKKVKHSVSSICMSLMQNSYIYRN